MPGFLNNILQIGKTHLHTTSWGTSLVVNGAVVASLAWIGGTLLEAPRLSGQRAAAQVELMASWTEPERPLAAAVEIAPADVIVLPDRVHIANRTYMPSPTDVSQRTPEESALVNRLLAAPAVPRRKPVSLPSTEKPSTEKPPRREISRQPRRVAIPKISVPQQQSTGTETLPRLLTNLPPQYPRRARVEGLEGTVVLHLDVTAEGRVGKLEIDSSSGHPILDAAAAQVVRSWRFEPARRFGLPIPYKVRLPVRFALD